MHDQMDHTRPSHLHVGEKQSLNVQDDPFQPIPASLAVLVVTKSHITDSMFNKSCVITITCQTSQEF